MWTRTPLRGFARDGYLIARDVVPAQARSAALARIDSLAAELAPQPGHTGHHFYFQDPGQVPELVALLTGSPAWALAEALTQPRRLRPPGQP